MTADRDLVMKVLEGQSLDYWIFPNASAFVAEDLDPRDVAATLEELHAERVVDRELLPIEGTGANDGGVEYVPGGYRLKRDEEPPQKAPTKRRKKA